MSSYRVVARSALQYREGSVPHLSAASGVAWLGDDLLVVDDASTFAGVFPQGKTPGMPLRLLPAVEGHDYFTEAAATKKIKPDIEVLAPLPDGTLLAMGSGSRNRGVGERRWRTKAAKISSLQQIEIFDLTALFEALTRWQEQLNLEGAVASQEGLLLFLRGNGIGGRPAIAEVKSWRDMLGGHSEIVSFREVTLPTIGGCASGFTDACRLPNGDILAALSAEASPDVYADGAVAGSALYDVQKEKVLPLLNQDGSPFREKLEGICPRGDSLDLFGVTDPDDPEQPGQLLWLQFEPQ
jgi:hypothetical protein